MHDYDCDFDVTGDPVLDQQFYQSPRTPPKEATPPRDFLEQARRDREQRRQKRDPK